MHGSGAQAALGLIVAALALIALANQRGGDDSVARAHAAVGGGQAGASDAVRALRDGQRLDVNRASAQELTLVPGIGPKLAERIVSERTRRGGFSKLAELRAVRGVGPKTLARISGFFEPLTVRTDTRTSPPP
ncbi:MAG TPA: helix-hairpin-helix domain-containing protein [Polyangiales bacterium]|nr:helix-hairpin-helix domain-containing protein [Polyangiales bacterium]